MATIPQPTPDEPRTYVAPDASGVATGSSGADDIYASGPGQTLIGNGGDDIFHIGTNTDAVIVENDPGISTVETWASSYVLADSVDNLVALGNYAHTLIGNAGANVITTVHNGGSVDGGAGDDVIDAGNTTGPGETFIYEHGGGNDRLINVNTALGSLFGISLDHMKLVDTGFTSFEQVRAAMTEFAETVGGQTVTSVRLAMPDASGSIVFQNHHVADFISAAFTFDNSGVAPTPTPAPAPATPIVGTLGNDSLQGTPAAESMQALQGDDVLFGSGGADALDGGSGYDIAVYTASPSGVTVDLAAGTGAGGDAQGDTFVNIEAVRGSSFDDTITGDAGANLLEGGLGNDTIHGGAGNDILLGGSRGAEIQASTTLFTGGELSPTDNTGADFLDGGAGNDTIIGGADDTILIHAGNGNDTIFNYAGSTIDIDGYGIGDLATLKSHATAAFGTITVDLGNGETLGFGFGPHPGVRSVGELDTMHFTFTNVQATATPAPAPAPAPAPVPQAAPEFTLAAATPNEPRGFVGTDASGVAHGTAGADDIFASGAGQTLIGGGGDDIFHIGTNTDAVIQETNPGISTVETWAASYTLPDPVDNLIALGDYAHTLTGNASSNAITGGAGNDVIDGRGGTDLLTGGGGRDTFVLGNGNGNPDHITDFNAADDVLDIRPITLSPNNLHLGDTDPFGHGLLHLSATADGGTEVLFDTGRFTAGGGAILADLVTLEHVAPSSLTAANFLFA